MQSAGPRPVSPRGLAVFSGHTGHVTPSPLSKWPGLQCSAAASGARASASKAARTSRGSAPTQAPAPAPAAPRAMAVAGPPAVAKSRCAFRSCRSGAGEKEEARGAAGARGGSGKRFSKLVGGSAARRARCAPMGPAEWAAGGARRGGSQRSWPAGRLCRCCWRGGAQSAAPSEALLPPEGSSRAGATTSAGRCMQRIGGRAGRAARRRARRPAKRRAEAGGGRRRAALRKVSQAARRLRRAARRAGAGAARARRAPGREERRGGAGEPRERDGGGSRRKVSGTSKATKKRDREKCRACVVSVVGPTSGLAPRWLVANSQAYEGGRGPGGETESKKGRGRRLYPGWILGFVRGPRGASPRA